MNLIVHNMICMSVVFSTAVIVSTNAGPINLLKSMVGHKKANNGTTRSKPAISSTVTTVVAKTSSGVNVHKATDTVKRLSTDKNDTVDRDHNVDRNRNNSDDIDHNAVLQRLCSAVLYAVTMPQCRREVTDDALAASHVTAGSNTVTLLAPTTAVDTVTVVRQQFAGKVQEGIPAAGRRRKRLPPIGIGLGAHAWHTKPAHVYRDPILAQETSRGVDYLTSYPLAKDDGGGGGDAEREEKYYEDPERPAKVWKIKVASEPMAKSSKNSAAAADEDDDDDDDELAAADNNSQ